MRKFLLRITIYILVIIVICISTFMLDPFNVIHVNNIRDVGVEPNCNYIKMKYILENPDKFDSFIFGSSRVGNLNTEKIVDMHCYNMTYAEGVPAEHYNNLRTLINNGIIPKTVYLGVDSLSYTASMHSHCSQAMRAPYEYLVSNPLKFITLYCDPAVNLKVIRDVFQPKAESIRFLDSFYECGWNTCYGLSAAYDKDNAEASFGAEYCLQDTLNDIALFVGLCKENDIKLIVFTNPLHPVTFVESFNREYETFLRKLATITPFYNFSALNEVTGDWNNFYDTSHAIAEVGDIELDYLQGKKEIDISSNDGFGMLVTENNVNDLIKVLKSQCQSFSHNYGNSW